MFKLYDPFNIKISNRNDIVLSLEEEEIIDGIWLPSVEEDNVLGYSNIDISEARNFMKILSEGKNNARITEARGRISLIDGTPRLSEVIRSIEKRRYVSIYYRHSNGEAGHRLIEPYAVGRGFVNPQGKIVNKSKIYIRGFVIMNSNSDKTIKGRFSKTKSVSVSDRRNRWRLFRLDRIERYTDMQKVFSSYRRQYNPNDKGIGTVLSSLQHSDFPRGENPKINW